MKLLHRSLIVAGLAGTLGLGAIAQSQTAPAAPAAPEASRPAMQGPHGRMDPQRMERYRARAEQQRAERLAELKTQLRITAQQEAAWNSWTSAIKPPARGQVQRPNRSEFLALSTPERIDRMRQLRSQHIAEMDRRGDATKAFYGTLSQEQQRVFDAVGMRYASGMHGKGGKGGFGRHGSHHRG